MKKELKEKEEKKARQRLQIPRSSNSTQNSMQNPIQNSMENPIKNTTNTNTNTILTNPVAKFEEYSSNIENNKHDKAQKDEETLENTIEDDEDDVIWEEIDEEEYKRNAPREEYQQNEDYTNTQQEDNRYSKEDEANDSVPQGAIKARTSSNWKRTDTRPSADLESYFIDVSNWEKPKQNQNQKNKKSNKFFDGIKQVGKQVGDFINKKTEPMRNKSIQVIQDVAVDTLKKHPKFKDFIIENVSSNMVAKHIGEKYGKLEYGIIKDLYGPHTAGILDTQHGKMLKPEYAKDAIVLDGVLNKRIEKYHDWSREKNVEQFRDYATTVNMDKAKGYYFKHNSEISKDIAKSKDMDDFLTKNKEAIITVQKKRCQLLLKMEI